MLRKHFGKVRPVNADDFGDMINVDILGIVSVHIVDAFADPFLLAVALRHVAVLLPAEFVEQLVQQADKLQARLAGTKRARRPYMLERQLQLRRQYARRVRNAGMDADHRQQSGGVGPGDADPCHFQRDGVIRRAVMVRNVGKQAKHVSLLQPYRLIVVLKQHRTFSYKMNAVMAVRTRPRIIVRLGDIAAGSHQKEAERMIGFVGSKIHVVGKFLAVLLHRFFLLMIQLAIKDICGGQTSRYFRNVLENNGLTD